MALTLGEAKIKALKLLDEYSLNGKLIDVNKNADYMLKMNALADMAQQELSGFRKIKAKYEISQATVSNLISNIPGIDSKQHLNNDLEFEVIGAKSYYFEVDNVSNIYIEEKISNNWVLIKSIDHTESDGFKAYKGNIEKQDESNPVKIRFSGNYVYNLRNIALYAYSFPTDEQIPSYSPEIKYQMPADFVEVDKVILEDTNGRYKELMNYYWESTNILVINYKYQGRISVNYFKMPSKITDTTPDSYEFEVDYTVANLIPFYIASFPKAEENPSLSGQYRRIYETGLINLDPEPEQGISVIEDINNW